MFPFFEEVLADRTRPSEGAAEGLSRRMGHATRSIRRQNGGYDSAMQRSAARGRACVGRPAGPGGSSTRWRGGGGGE